MSGFYLIGVVALWLWLTWRLLRFGKRMLSQENKTDRSRRVLTVAIIIAWFGASFWYGGGRKLVYDAVVLSLCAKDGGVKVYETVALSATEYDQFAKRNWAFPEKSRATQSDKYYSETKRHYYQNNDPKIMRRQFLIIRRSDDKILGEDISYSSSGGDLPGPWHPSSFICPKISPNRPGIARSIFYKE